MFKKILYCLASRRPAIASPRFILLSALYFGSILNLSLWRYVSQHLEITHFNTAVFALTLPLFIGAALYFIFNLLLWPYLVRVLWPLLLLISSAANYMMFNYGIYIDSDMVRNIFQTNTREAHDLVTPSGVLWVLLTGLIPALYAARVKIIYRPFFKETGRRLLSGLACLLIILLIGAVSYKDYVAFGRNNSQVKRLINPTNYLNATFRYFQKQAQARRPFVDLDPQAKLVPFADPEYTVVILVVGETARSMNFSLNGYARPTNPQLAREDVISFQNMTSCGTATAVSVPCLFSERPRENFDAARAPYTENLLDIIQRSDYQVQWLDNDDGCKDVCKRVPTEYMIDSHNPAYCQDKSCYDGILLEALDKRLQNITGDTLIVLHTIGSHGPTYFQRYPPEFKVFTPTCDTADIQNCPREAIINTYDNTILYTDHILAGVINLLKNHPNFESGMLYVSDHGESLGENNIYLHGLPYSIAPTEQTHVPMIMWLSENMRRYDHLDYNCLKKISQTDAYSHDHLFHSLLGLTEIKSKLYDPQYDFFRPCRTIPLPAEGVE